MKKFTKLIGLMMTFLLFAALVQSQSVSSGNFKIANSDIVQPGGNGEDIAIPDSYSAEQKGIYGTDDMNVVVLDNNGFISSNRRAPSNGSNYQRGIYLVTPTNMTGSGITTGTILNSIGWQIYQAGVGTLTGTLNIYLLNTADATFTLGTSWSGAIGSFTQVYNNASYTIPIALGWFDVPFTTNFNYTGGGIYVAWEFSAVGTPGSTVVIHWVNATLTGGNINAFSNTAMPDVLTSNASRPMTRLGLSGIDDIVAITSVYTLEKAPIPYGAPVSLGAGLGNITASPVTTNVTLEIRKVSDNSLLYTNTQPITIPAASYNKVFFTSWIPTITEDVKYIAFTDAIPGDTWTFNNTKTIFGNVNSNLYSYFYTPSIASNFGGGAGIFANKFTMTGSGLITGINVVIGNHSTNTGKIISGVLLNSAGVIVAQSPNYTILLGDLGLSKTFTFTAPALITNDVFYAGIYADMVLGVHYPVAIANELPQRGGMIYTFDLTGGTPFEETLDYKQLIEASVIAVPTCDPPASLYVSGITQTAATLNWTSNSGLSDIEIVPAGTTPTEIPTAGMAGKTSPFVLSSVYTLTAGTSYDVYVRDVCAGPTYSIWVKTTANTLGFPSFTTICEPCPTGSTPEGEGQLPNGSDGSGINGGCAVSLPLLTSPLAFNQIYCGESNTFLNNLGANSRDNDYYYVNLNSPSCIYWSITATVKGNYNGNMTIFNAGDMTCGISSIGTLNFSPCNDTALTLTVPSGNYYVVVRVYQAAGNYWPVGSGPWQYTLSLTGSQLGAPNMDPNPPASFTKEVPPGGSTTDAITFSNIGNQPLIWSASCTGNNQISFFDDFETYIAGQQLACQMPDTLTWGTWSNLPCNATEDGYIVTSQAFSGTKSLSIVTNNDQIKYFNHITAGKHSISFMQKIPTGKAGYFNLLSKFMYAAPNLYNYWAVDIYFNANGTFTVGAASASAPIGTWTANQWRKVEVIVDLDNDAGYFYYNGSLVSSWTWTLGSSAGTGPLALDAMDLFGATASDEMYVDDFKLELIQPGWLTLDGDVSASGTIPAFGGPTTINVGFNSVGWPAGTYTNTINISTNELCAAKSIYSIPVTFYVGYSISGNVYYGKTGTGKPMATLTSVILKQGTTTIATVPTTTNGAYVIRGIGNGAYKLYGSTTKAAGGYQAFDASMIAKFAGGALTLVNLEKRAGDVNLSVGSGPNAFDATQIKKRLATGIKPTVWTAPDYVFDGPYTTPALDGLPVTVSFGNVLNLELRTLCSGDLNGSWPATQ